MSITADQLRDLMALGLSGEQLVAVVAVFDRALPATLPATLPDGRSRKAINQARYRENLKAKQGASVAMAAAPSPDEIGNAVTGNVADGVTVAPLSTRDSVDENGSPKKAEDNSNGLSKKPRARGTRLPDDWVPSETDRQYAASRGLRAADIETEATKFRNYWTNRTDRQASKPRWDRAWQNWILNVRGTTNGQAPRDRSRDDFRMARERLKQFGEGQVGGGHGGDTVRLLPAAGRG